MHTWPPKIRPVYVIRYCSLRRVIKSIIFPRSIQKSWRERRMKLITRNATCNSIGLPLDMACQFCHVGINKSKCNHNIAKKCKKIEKPWLLKWKNHREKEKRDVLWIILIVIRMNNVQVSFEWNTYFHGWQYVYTSAVLMNNDYVHVAIWIKIFLFFL
jgi:hypothetical protein